jgi:hypothetical protein
MEFNMMLTRLRSVQETIRRATDTTIDDLDDWINKAIDADEMQPVEFDDTSISEPPLSAEELRTARVALAQWYDPTDFRRAVHALHRRSSSAEILNNPHHNFLLDAWTLAEFVHHKAVEGVRLTPPEERWPDGEVRVGGKIESVEVTIALEPGRKLGAEYKFPGNAELDPVENWARRADQIPAALEKAITDKIGKQYSNCGRMWLVIYLNINDGGIRQADCEAQIAEIKKRHVATFGNLSVLWKDKLL